MQVVSHPGLYFGAAVIQCSSCLVVYNLILLSASSVGPSYLSRLWICREWYHETVSTKSIQRQTCQRKVKESGCQEYNTLLRVHISASATQQALRSCLFDSHAITFIIIIILIIQTQMMAFNPGQSSGLYFLFSKDKCLSEFCHEGWGEIFWVMLDWLFSILYIYIHIYIKCVCIYICFEWQANLPRNLLVLHAQKGLHDFLLRYL